MSTIPVRISEDAAATLEELSGELDQSKREVVAFFRRVQPTTVRRLVRRAVHDGRPRIYAARSDQATRGRRARADGALCDMVMPIDRRRFVKRRGTLDAATALAIDERVRNVLGLID